jgi:hypothetical protein
MAFASSYLAPHGIESMLDVPVQIEGELAGIISFEHTASTRAWQPDEITFAGRVADQVALIMENKRRRMARSASGGPRRTDQKLPLHGGSPRRHPHPPVLQGFEPALSRLQPRLHRVMGVSREELVGKTTRELWARSFARLTRRTTALCCAAQPEAPTKPRSAARMGSCVK